MNLLQVAANVPSPPSFNLWIILGFIFILLGVVVGEPTVASLGIAAIITAIAALSVSSVALQIVLWGILSIALTIVLRGMVPLPTKEELPDTEAVVSEMIPKGGVGWVSYEGALWKARCQVSDVSIASGQTVQVVGRHGLTLIVLPLDFTDEPYDTVT
ncbi:NfeD family protein [Leptolyngbya sp. 7M]|uniref:NfeD family protein n=1 Tax=Leptolyngbya sp. NK1-12 TaxID=2547451 RepID=A0AA96WBP1_9CYAN|nr:NfeD family protein [Leptolyngbya sp. 7M]MBF2045881.1 NfeD family protein [Elainella sp. C42_A2020_010]QYO67568.1 NfeD family protein [Leptolyngbya sp. 7M]WNZ22253.1 NfeD family protein [Leptolyngbya sp. NK1-12]